MESFRPSIQNLPMSETWRDRAKLAMKGTISQEELAERIGTSQPGLSHWLNSRSQPSLDDINRIADEIGVSRVWLTHGLGYESGPGKVLLDLLLSAKWADEQLSPLAVTAQAILKAPVNQPLAHGAPEVTNLLEKFAADPDALTPDAMIFLEQQLSKHAKNKKAASPTKERSRRRAKG